MKRRFLDFSQHYGVALQDYLKSPCGNLQEASKLGCRAAGLDMEKLELAGIHEYAFSESKVTGSKKVLARRSVAFFKDTLTSMTQGALGDVPKQSLSLLDQSLRSQTRLRQKAHLALKKQENVRQNISRGLQNEVAQTLLGLNVHLLSLKKGARRNTRGLKNQIANTQKLVLESLKSVLELARQLDIQQQGKKEIPRLLRSEGR